MTRALMIAGLLLAMAPVHAATASWEKLEDCELIPNPANDGDSFHVRHRGQEYIFRLYFVDCPETENEFPDRVAEQAKYFHVTPEQAWVLGKRAARYTTAQLRGHFTVYTRWQDARGNSRLPRYYAFVMVDDKELAESLVEQGFARVFGERAIKPNGTSARSVVEKLDRLERAAQRAHRGAWGTAGDLTDTPQPRNALPSLPVPRPATNAPAATDEILYKISKSGIRHNKNCRYFDAPNNTPCSPDEGRPCRICGG